MRLGKYLEARAKSGAGEAIRKLLFLRPKQASLIRNGAEVEVNVDDVVIGDIVVVHPGEKIPWMVRCLMANQLLMNPC